MEFPKREQKRKRPIKMESAAKKKENVKTKKIICNNTHIRAHYLLVRWTPQQATDNQLAEKLSKI